MADEAERLDAVRERRKRVRTAAATAALFGIGREVLQRYDDYKAARAMLDFSDLIERTRALLAADVAQVGKRGHRLARECRLWAG